MAYPSELADRVGALELRIADLESIIDRNRRRRHVSVPPRVAEWLEIETALGLTWFNRLGAVALVAALAFAAAWANDQGYLSPAVRTVLAGAVAFGLLVLACFKLGTVRGARRAFFTGIAILGAGGLFVVPAAAARVDHLITDTAAIAILVVVTIGCLCAAALLRAYALALVATVGGALAPLVAQTGEPSFALAIAYVAALAVASVGLQLRSPLPGKPGATPVIGGGDPRAPRSPLPGKPGATPVIGGGDPRAPRSQWRGLDAIAILALAGYSIAWTISSSSAESAAVGAGVWAAAIGYDMWRRAVAPDRAAEIVRSQVSLLAVVAGGGALLAAGAAWSVIALVSANLWVWRDPNRPRQMVQLLALAAAGTVAFPSLLGGAILLPFLWQAIRRDEPMLAVVTNGLVAVVWIRLGLEANQGGLAGVAVLAYAVTAVFIGIDERKLNRNLSSALIASGGACAVAAAWPLAVSVFPGRESLVLTVAATIVGLVLVGIGMITDSRSVRGTGLAFVGAVAAKLVFVDVWALSSGTRVLALCALGLGFLGVSFLYSRVVASPPTVNRRAPNAEP